MNNDDRIKNAMQNHEVPKELEPENISKMLKDKKIDKSKIKSSSNISRRARIVRFTAAAAACAVLITGVLSIYNYNKNGLTDGGLKSSHSSQATSTESTNKLGNYMAGANSYDEIYDAITKSYKQQQKEEKRGGIAGFFNSLFGSKNMDTNTTSSAYAEKGEADGITDGAIANEEAEYNDSTNGTSDSDDFSNTITQVEGVEEADIIKTDGKNIFYTVGQKLYAVTAKDGVFGEIQSHTIDGNVISMFLVDGKIVLIYSEISDYYKTYSDDVEYSSENYRYDIIGGSTTGVLTFNMSDGKLNLENTYTQDGSYSDSRMIGNTLYLISNKYNMQVGLIDDAEDIEAYVPSYTCGTEPSFVEPDDILIPSNWKNEYSGLNYAIIGGIDINDMSEPVSIKALADYSGQLYCSQNNIYITGSIYESNTNCTSITRLAIDNGSIQPMATGKVDGYVLNQFSMSEYNSYFRIATTTDNFSSSANGRSNGVYVLNEKLEVVGSVDDFGKTESIKSVNFSGDIAYVVTYMQTDPLFAIDLSNPTSPTILGELKINGYSSYMHSWSDGLLLGFGVDADENGFEKGVKLVMFDVSDNGDLKENGIVVLNTETMGRSYVYSDAVHDHKQLLINAEKNIIGFPVITESYSYYFMFKYENGEFKQIGYMNNSNTSNLYVNRAVYIGEYVYMFSSGNAVSASINDMTKVDEISLN
ncbi:MAG TPA: hypothetical protein GX710_06610 [Clostridiales bacterium]|nr:hypothetical protein [Clostridiales bacterium]